jgi:hypothetical protein
MATVLSIVAISISGLTLVWTIGWSVYTHRKATRADVTVRASYSLPVYGPTVGDPAISITATNTGSVTVTLIGCQLRIKGSEDTLAPVTWVAQTPHDLPTVLEPGEHWNALVDIESIRQTLVDFVGPRASWKVKPYVRDASDKEHDSPNWIEIGAK